MSIECDSESSIKSNTQSEMAGCFCFKPPTCKKFEIFPIFRQKTIA